MAGHDRNIRNVIIMGAAGRDFHDFNVFFRDNPAYSIKAFTAAQLPNISGRRYPKELAGRLYPAGIPIFPEDELPELVRKSKVDVVVLAYSDLSYKDVMRKASAAMAAGTDFWMLGPESTQIKSKMPVVAVCATRTGSGKTTVSRRVAELLRSKGRDPVIIRHPMPYGDLKRQIVQRFASKADLDRNECTIEEREEYEPYIEEGFKVFAGVDYEKVLRAAEKEGDVIVYEGGNNDFPLIKPDLLITVADPLRAGDEIDSYPGEVNARMADILIINKANTASRKEITLVRKNLLAVNKNGRRAKVVVADSVVGIDKPGLIKGKRVIIVEDGPTVTHGGLKCSAGCIAARKFGARVSDVSPRSTVGSISATIRKYSLRVIPALGYGKRQIKELESSIARAIKETGCDAVLLGTSSDLRDYVRIGKPVARVRYSLRERGESLDRLIKIK